MNTGPIVPYNEQFAPLAPSQVAGWNYFSPYQNAPGGAIGQQVLAMAGGMLGSQTGMMPMGGMGTNLHSTIHQQMFSASHMRAMQSAAQNDQQIMLDIERGMMAAAGRKLTDSDIQGLNKLNGFLSNVAPYIDPQMMNTLSGGRSASNLTRYMHIGGQFRRDAVTGFSGMSGDTSASIAQGVYQHYFSNPDYGQATAGLNSLQMGEMFDELTRRGMMPGIGTLRQRVAGGIMAARSNGADVTGILKGAGVDLGLTPVTPEGLMNLSDTQLQKLSANTDIQHGMRSADAGRITATLDKYKGAIAAVQEIFGENGKPNAPMPELMQALERLTQGGMTQLSPGRVEMTVRNMSNAAKMAGVDMVTLSGMMNAAGSQTDALGLNPLFATQITNSGLLFSAGYNAAGLGENPAWGLQNNKQMTASHMASVGRAAGSSLANRMGALLRLSERIGAPTGSAALMLSALRNGDIDPSWNDMSSEKFFQIMSSGFGISTSEAQKALQHTDANQEFIHKYNLADTITRTAQPHEIRKLVASPRFSSAAYDMLAKSGVKSDKLAKLLGDSSAAALWSLDPATATDAKKRIAAVRSQALTDLEAEAKADPNGDAAKFLQSFKGDTAARDKALNAYIETGYADTQHVYKNQLGGEDLVSLLVRQSAPAAASSQQAKADMEIRSALQSKAAGFLSGGSPLFNLMRTLQQTGATGEAGILKVLSGAAGFTDKKALAGRLAHDLSSLEEEQRKLTDLVNARDQAGTANNPELARQLEQRVEARMNAIKQIKAQIGGYMDDNQLSDLIGEAVENRKAEGEGDKDGKDGAVTYNNATINLTVSDGTITLKGASGKQAAKSDNRNGTPVA
jgi:hypothetical protein